MKGKPPLIKLTVEIGEADAGDPRIAARCSR